MGAAWVRALGGWNRSYVRQASNGPAQRSNALHVKVTAERPPIFSGSAKFQRPSKIEPTTRAGKARRRALRPRQGVGAPLAVSGYGPGVRSGATASTCPPRLRHLAGLTGPTAHLLVLPPGCRGRVGTSPLQRRSSSRRPEGAVSGDAPGSGASHESSLRRPWRSDSARRWTMAPMASSPIFARHSSRNGVPLRCSSLAMAPGTVRRSLAGGFVGSRTIGRRCPPGSGT
jgi:hypothetical protein